MEIVVQELAAYPRWMVALVLSVAAFVIIWVGVKLLKWTLYAAAAVLLGVTLAGIILWWLG